VADGDTITVLDAEKQQIKIRLQGIDAPEKAQAFGNVSRKSLSDKVFDKTVRITWKDKDKYGRVLGEIHLGDRHINREQVIEGMAWWYEKYCPDDSILQEAEKQAKKEKRGLWRDLDTAAPPIAPWDFRQAKRDKSARRSGKSDSTDHSEK
jgi:endonuclease YncB( thermonuclease family)